MNRTRPELAERAAEDALLRAEGFEVLPSGDARQHSRTYRRAKALDLARKDRALRAERSQAA